MLSLTINLRCFYNILSRLDVDKLLHLIALLNSLVKKRGYSNTSLDGISIKMLVLT